MTTATATKNEKKKALETKTIDKETNIWIEKVDVHVLDHYLGIVVPGGVHGSVTHRLHRLSKFFAEKTVVSTSAKVKEPTPERPCIAVMCDTCGGKSDLRLKKCPYCGDAEIDPKDAPGDADATEREGIRILTGHDPQQALVPAKPRQRRRIDGETNGQAELPTTNGAAAEPPKDGMAQAIIPHDELQAHQAELVTPPDIIQNDDPTATLQDLDEAVARMHLHASSASGSFYDLGNEMANTFARKLWTKRTKAGAPAYTGWTQFCEAELPVSVGRSYQLMDVATKFDRPTFTGFGVAKLLQALRVPEEHRPAMLEATKQGATLRELKERAVELQGGKTAPPRETGRGGFKGTPNAAGRPVGKPSGKLPAPPPEPAKRQPLPAAPSVTVHLVQERTKMPLFARPKNKHDEPKPAKRLADDPWTIETLSNGVQVRYMVQVTRKGTLELVREFVKK
jgi:hypothetical protein